jgi:RNA polymerase-binding transcription factor DksA
MINSSKNGMASTMKNKESQSGSTASAKPLLAKDFKYFEGLLQQKLTELEENIRSLDQQSLMDSPQGAGDLNTVRTHPADQGTQMADQERNRAVADLESRQVVEIQSALRRIQDGSYGVCANCGEDIPRVRLEAVPWAAFDVRCQTENELAQAVARERNGRL